jgi:hypothetical protein
MKLSSPRGALQLAVNGVTHNHRQWCDMLWLSRGPTDP